MRGQAAGENPRSHIHMFKWGNLLQDHLERQRACPVHAMGFVPRTV